MNIYPNLYLDNVKNINPTLLKKNNISGLILDVDNTLIDYYRNMIDGLEKWCEEIKQEGIKCIILSNSNKKDKVETVAKKLDIDYIMFAKKPMKSGFKRALEKLELKNSQVAVVGDQLFTDVLGAKRMNMFSILVKQVAEKDIFITKVKRPIENAIIKKYLKERGKS
ncbi:MAG: YqeG family HAD IIIA-type phosphatase [Clostridia bacterium]|nr:YqeG family HAD IIIA-type phosphatase [Clostridia bacterium]